jgi:uncharacterized protein DUF6916
VAVSRRIFLRQGVLAAVGCAATPLLASTPKRPTGGDDQTREANNHVSSGSSNWQDHAAALDHLGRSQFASAIGSDFKVTVDGSAQPIWLTLTAVNDLPSVALANQAGSVVRNQPLSSAPTTSGFVLVFWSSSDLPQGSHLFQHSGLGNFALFTVPAGNGQQTFIATVNRLEQSTIIAVPRGVLSAQPAGQSPASVSAPPAATSSTVESHPGAPAGTQDVQRSPVRD